MVRGQQRGTRSGVLGKLTGDPAVTSAAVAVTFGINPLWFLGLAPHDYVVAAAAVAKAQELRDKQARGLADYQSSKTAGLTARAITRWIARSFKK